MTDGILTLKEDKVVVSGKKGEVVEESEEAISMRITRRGALEASKALARKFGGSLFEDVPKFWEGISGALLTTFVNGKLFIKERELRS